MGIERKNHSGLVAVVCIDDSLLFIEATAQPVTRLAINEIRPANHSTSSPDCNRQTKAKNRAFRRESVISVPMKRRFIGKLLHEIGMKVRVVSKNIRMVDGELPVILRRSSKFGCPLLQVFTLHRNEVSRIRIAVNSGLRLIR